MQQVAHVGRRLVLAGPGWSWLVLYWLGVELGGLGWCVLILYLAGSLTVPGRLSAPDKVMPPRSLLSERSEPSSLIGTFLETYFSELIV